MKKMLPVLLICSLVATSVYADTTTVISNPTVPQIKWISKNSNDPFTIQNGAGIPLVITITVNPGPSVGAVGVNVKNCGTTTHIDAGSATVCSTSDSNNPVTLTSDSATMPATGTYQLKPS